MSVVSKGRGSLPEQVAIAGTDTERPQTNETDLATQLARMSLDLQAQQDEPLTLERIVELAVQAVPGCDWAGVSLRSRRSPAEPAAATDQRVGEADELQRLLSEGPCYDTSLSGEVHIAVDTRVDQQWPEWSPRVAELGIMSVLSVQLRGAAGELFGALNLYASEVDAFSRNDLDEALLFAVHAGGALSQSRELTGLREALRSRHLIGVAQGILMQRYDLTLDQAFAVLSRHSQDSNIKLRELAEQIVEAGGLLGRSAQSTSIEATG